MATLQMTIDSSSENSDGPKKQQRDKKSKKRPHPEIDHDADVLLDADRGKDAFF
jgi:ATP-dependent RNA helicase DDX27